MAMRKRRILLLSVVFCGLATAVILRYLPRAVRPMESLLQSVSKLDHDGVIRLLTQAGLKIPPGYEIVRDGDIRIHDVLGYRIIDVLVQEEARPWKTGVRPLTVIASPAGKAIFLTIGEPVELPWDAFDLDANAKPEIFIRDWQFGRHIAMFELGNVVEQKLSIQSQHTCTLDVNTDDAGYPMVEVKAIQSGKKIVARWKPERGRFVLHPTQEECAGYFTVSGDWVEWGDDGASGGTLNGGR